MPQTALNLLYVNFNVKLILSNRNAIAIFLMTQTLQMGKKKRKKFCLSVWCYLRYLEWVDWVNMNTNMSIIFRFS